MERGYQVAYCMDAVTGDDRHEGEVRYADYEVYRTESFVASNWCGACLLEYIESGMGSCVEFVTLTRAAVDLDQHDKVVKALEPFGVTVKQP
jgi:hypothetical protein